MARAALQVPDEAIADFCRRHHMRRLAFFGSILRDDFGPDSDIDVLVEFEPGRTPGLAFFQIEEELSRILGRPVTLNTRVPEQYVLIFPPSAHGSGISIMKPETQKSQLSHVLRYQSPSRRPGSFGAVVVALALVAVLGLAAWLAWTYAGESLGLRDPILPPIHPRVVH